MLSLTYRGKTAGPWPREKYKERSGTGAKGCFPAFLRIFCIAGRFLMHWMDKLERKLGRYAVPHMMYVVTGIMLAVFAANLVLGGIVSPMLFFHRGLILQGQVWRIITFIFLPPSTSVLWIAFSLYFYCLMGNALESAWGTFRFNLFYLCGVAGSILAGFITGTGVNHFLNMSLFFAYAAVYPENQIMLFFFLPIKVKWLAAANALYFLYMFVVGGWTARAAILFSLLNIWLFFGGDLFRHIRQQAGYWKTRRQFRKNNRF